MRIALSFAALLGSCATTQHGTITSMSVSSTPGWKACPHGVPEEVCVRCHPERVESYRKRGDWCAEHDVPESQCLACHPDLDFSPPKEPPPGADVVQLVRDGADLDALEPHRVEGKVTIFDFHAAWCPPCRKVDEHLYAEIRHRDDLAIRKIDVGSWDTPVARRFLGGVAELPHLIVYGRDGRRIAEISGARLDEIDAAIDEGSR